MQLKHTLEEIIFWDQQTEYANELMQLSNKFNNAAGICLAADIKNSITNELAKYQSLIGTKVSGVIEYKDNKPKFTGTIVSITHFNAYSKSVRCNVSYTTIEGISYAPGFDGYALIKLELLP